MLELWQTEWCPASRRVRQRLTELGVDYLIRQVPVERADRHALGAAVGADTIPRSPATTARRSSARRRSCAGSTGGCRVVSAVDAERMLSIVDNHELAEVAGEVRRRLADVVERAVG